MIKIFCNSCHEFIRDVGLKEINSLSGQEICGKCGQGITSRVAVIEKKATQAISAIEKTKEGAISQINQIRRSIIEPEPEKEKKK